MNPFELARTVLFTPWDAERVFVAIDGLLRDGFVEGDVRYRLFGGRIGRVFSLSHGLPLLGGGTPVLHGRIRDGVGSTALEVSVGARHELIVFGAFWALLTLLGGGYQLLLQCRRVLAGEAGWGAVFEVLPGIAIMAAIVLVGVGWWRHMQRPQAHALIERLRLHVEGSDAVAHPAPLAPRAIT